MAFEGISDEGLSVKADEQPPKVKSKDQNGVGTGPTKNQRPEVSHDEGLNLPENKDSRETPVLAPEQTDRETEDKAKIGKTSREEPEAPSSSNNAPAQDAPNEPPKRETDAVGAKRRSDAPPGRNGGESKPSPPAKPQVTCVERIPDFFREGADSSNIPKFSYSMESTLAPSDDGWVEHCTSRFRVDEAPLQIGRDDTIHWCTALWDKRTIVLCSHSTRVLLSAVLRIVENAHFREAEHRVLLREWGTQNALACCFRPASSDHDVVLVVDACDKSKQSFLDDLLGDPAIGWTQHKEHLTALRRFLVVLTTPARIQERIDAGCMLTVFTVPFELPLIQSVESRSDEASLLAEEFRAQAAKGLWGKSEEEQCQQLGASIVAGLLHEKLNRQATPEASTDANLPELGVDPLVDTILFLATFFPHIAVIDFQDLTLGIVGNDVDVTFRENLPQTLDSESSESISDSVNDTKQAGQTAYTKKIRSKSKPPPLLRERWLSSSHALLKRCGLRVMADTECAVEERLTDAKASELRTSLIFDAPGRSGQLAKMFTSEHHFFYLSAFEKLRCLGTLFHPSHTVVETFVGMAANLAAANPQRYGTPWLLELMVSAGPSLEGLEVATPEDANQLRRLRSVLDIHQARHRFIFDRLQLLVREMLKHKSLKGVVEDSLVQLCANQLHEAVLELSIRLSYAPNWNAFCWFRRLLDESPVHVRKRTADHLMRLACGAKLPGLNSVGSGPAAVLLQLRQWVIEGKLDRLSSEAGLQITIAIGEQALSRSPLDLVRGEVDVQGLFGWLADRHAPLDTLETLVEWVFDSKLDSHLTKNVAWPSYVAGVIHCWFAPSSVIGIIGPNSDRLLNELLAVWYETLSGTHMLDARLGGPLFQVIVFTHVVYRLMDQSSNDRVGLLAEKIRNKTNQQQLKRIVAFSHAPQLSLEKVINALSDALPRLLPGQRDECRRFRDRAKELRGFSRYFRDQLRASH